MTLEGGCKCGAVRYEVVGETWNSTICHCEDCRRVAGAPMVAWFTVKEAELVFAKGEPRRFDSSPGVTRGFCAACGTCLTFQNQDGVLDVTTCSLDDPEALPPTDHVRASGRLSWVKPADGLTRYLVLRSGRVEV